MVFFFTFNIKFYYSLIFIYKTIVNHQKITIMKTISTIILFYLISNSIFSQTKDISKLTENEKTQELIESLDWLQSKIGGAMEFRNNKGYYYSHKLIYNESSPTNLSIITYKTENQEVLSTLKFDLKKIYYLTANSGTSCFISIGTYERQRFITVEENGESLLDFLELISYDCAVSEERMQVALNYILKLAGGSKKIIYEKF